VRKLTGLAGNFPGGDMAFVNGQIFSRHR
jgi:hypothetical protein